MTIQSFSNEGKQECGITGYAAAVAKQIRDNMHATCIDANAHRIPAISYYNHTLPVLGKNSERASQLIIQAELVGTLRYALYSEAGSWPHPVCLSDVLWD